ncbi:PorT family protein [Lacihabitans sp. LS3-19]|uniref:porin family protein n=1 Tax=Lacihabitans sp. LS3-19 TaxID=2487335 RepID=UPI0020CE8D8A|nr:porin family protein [Lacihabitans sp. LS3-19]MCP9768929.1 PorT family protein [Lacihabitans sp. LS3-19]
MKKLITVLMLLVIATGVSQAQNFEIGLKGGLNLSQIRGEGGGSDKSFWDPNASRVTGFTGGIFTKFGNKIYLQPELMVSTKGGKAYDVLGIEHNFKQTYFDIPVLLGVKVGDVLRINAGPMATFLINKDETFMQQIGLASNEKYRNAFLGYQFGVGFDISKIRLDMKYEGNVNDVFNVNYKDAQTKSQFAGKSNAFMITAGFAF